MFSYKLFRIKQKVNFRVKSSLLSAPSARFGLGLGVGRGKDKQRRMTSDRFRIIGHALFIRFWIETSPPSPSRAAPSQAPPGTVHSDRACVTHRGAEGSFFGQNTLRPHLAAPINPFRHATARVFVEMHALIQKNAIEKPGNCVKRLLHFEKHRGIMYSLCGVRLFCAAPWDFLRNG